MRLLLPLLLLACTLHAADASIAPGQVAQMQVTVASGTAPFTYQWRKDGVAIAGATGASFTATAPGSYSVVVANKAGSTTSNTVVIDAIPAPSGVAITVTVKSTQP